VEKGGTVYALVRQKKAKGKEKAGVDEQEGGGGSAGLVERTRAGGSNGLLDSTA